MSYFPDLSEYAYAVRVHLPNVLHVGWLEPEHSFETGPVEPAILEKLLHLAEHHRAHQMRGYQLCRLSPECRARGYDDDVEPHRMSLGSAEVWIRDPTSHVIYASPCLIVHYIQHHAYRPPDEFMRAVEAFDPAQWDPRAESHNIITEAYRAAAIAKGWDVNE